MKGKFLYLFVAVVATLFLLATSTAYGGDALQPKNQLRVFDASGKRVGSVLSVSSGATVAFQVEGHTFVVEVTRDGFHGFGDARIFFESSDCSGTPFIGGDALFRSVVTNPGRTVYVVDSAATTQGVIFGSWFEDGLDGCVVAEGDCPDCIRALALIDLGAVFTPPFTVR